MNIRTHSFYTYPGWVQWLVSLLLLLCLLLCCLGVVALIRINPVWALLTLLLIPISQFAVSPLFTLLGLYHYLSPILLIYLPTKKSFELHHASSFDYLFLWHSLKDCPDRKRQILLYYLEGLINLIQLIESNKVPADVSIEGITYFVNKRTSKLMGLSLLKPSKIKRYSIYLNVLDFLWMYSLTCRSIRLPSLNQLGHLQGNGRQLMASKQKLVSLYRRLLLPNSEVVTAAVSPHPV